ncbi:MAG: GntR family transcriptional regulator [Spirochaetota bacterium]|nr:GntR family transcriptional regulator [Spirochaetota bacterium]
MHATSTISDSIYSSLKKEILELRFKPGEKLSETKLSRKYEVSRAPVRDALHRLQEEGIVLVRPQIGTIVSPISLKKARDICQIRLLLEPFSAGIAAEKITDSQCEDLHQGFEQLINSSGDKEDIEKLVFEVDTKLHHIIWELSENEEICSILSGYKWQIHRIRLATAELAGRLTPSLREMQAIYEALVKKDPIEAADAMRNHILNISKAVEAFLVKQEIK